MSEEPQDQQNIATGFRFRWWWALVLLVLFAFAFVGDKGVLRLIKTYNQRSDLQQQVDKLAAENLRLKKEIEGLQTDYRTIERIARQELGMVRKDEVVYQFPNRKTQPKTAPQQSK